MAAPSTTRTPKGFRHCQVFALSTAGYPLATTTAAYEGVQMEGARALEITDPAPQQIVHRGDDRIYQMDVLPATEPATFTMRAGPTKDALDAILTDDKSITVGEMKLFGFGTDNRGEENQVCILAYAQATDDDPASGTYGARRWEYRLFPRCYVIPSESGFVQDAESERTFTGRPQFVTKYPWGVTFNASTEGFTRAQGCRGVATYKPILVAFLGNNTATAFAFPTDKPAADAAKIITWVNGTEQTADITEATTGLTFTTAPTTGAFVVCAYEYD